MSISYQLHSRNDLREWNAMFRKGGRSIKIDPHFLKNSDQFILSHDPPLPGQYTYSTLDDVLDYFRFPPTFLAGKSIDIALCFKSAPKPLCGNSNSTAVRQWLGMTEKFFTQAANVVRQVKETTNIKLTFVLDGDGKPCNCLAGKFRPWNSTWIDEDQCSLDCYTSNHGFCQRYTILNDPTRSDWKGMKATHYGKFGLQNHSLQVWEPDSLVEISTLVEGYLQGHAERVPSGTGLAFAINIDHSMFNVFTARSLVGPRANGFNVVIQDDNSTLPHLIYQSPGKMTLQYWAESKPLTRQLTYEPFSQIQVGPSFQDTMFRRLGSDMHSRRLYERFVIDYFGNTQLSWSAQKVGNLSFLFAAVGGRVFASVQSNEVKQAQFRLIGLGTNVHASSFNDTLLLVTEGNNCYNSHIHNTQSGPLVCSPKTQDSDACPYALDYSVGTAENWFLWLQQPQAVITACNEYILHGTFSAGRNPSGALFPLEHAAENENAIGIMVAHEPYPLQEESKCGTPATGDAGIVVSSFASTVVRERFTEVVALATNKNILQLQRGSVQGSNDLRWCFGGVLLLVLWWVRWRQRSTFSYEAIEE